MAQDSVHQVVQGNETVADQVRDIDPNVRQRKASDPGATVWVGASAGTGKTKVLTDRVLRLLLPRAENIPGTPPHKILCLTFTKAAASEMALRINRTLSRWAIMPDEELAVKLRGLLGREPEAYEQAAARKLFAGVVDTPGGLKIMTIHSFCQSVLSRFPLEAGLPPHFAALEEVQAMALMADARGRVLGRVAQEPASPPAQALNALAQAQNEDQFENLLRQLSQERTQMRRLLDRHFGVDGLYAALCALLEVPAGTAAQDILAAGCSGFDEPGLRRVCTALAGGKISDQSKADSIQAFLDAQAEDRLHLYSDYRKSFLTQKDTVLNRLATKTVKESHPDCERVMTAEAERLQALEEKMRAASCAAMTRDLLLLGDEILKEYERLKNARAALDFDDLIVKTLDLLTGTVAGKGVAPWVMFKLDQGIDHILIDEAQDTNPEQWDIIRALCDDFFSGEGAHDGRTVFTVGDEKQSIYSFQRAAPEAFDEMRAHFERRVTEAQQKWEPVDLNISFRSTKSVLRAVDEVFADEAVREGLGMQVPQHISFRRGQAGLVELWPLFETSEKEDDDPWMLPLSTSEGQNGPAALAEHIGEQIAGWISKEALPSKGRAVEPGDIMILVRTRTAFVGQLVRALKTRNIPVSGVDRMVLGDQLAVQDLLALAQFALQPEDDLSLAFVLKSPLLGWDEDRLYALAHGRGSSLWAALQKADYARETGWLSALIEDAGSAHPYEFFCRILQQPCPADEESGLRAVKKRLGADALDPLDELLNAALVFEAGNIPALQGFVHVQEQGRAEIKRELEEAGGHVRIMTVHGAKGLQAPIVILPDTTRTGAAKRTPRLLWPDKSGLPLPLWSVRSDMDCALFREGFEAAEKKLDEEYRRLLYVAMTRAEDRLYVAGATGRRGTLDESWYDYVRRAFERMKDAEEEAFDASDETKATLRIHNPQTGDPDGQEEKEGWREAAHEIPVWLKLAAPAEPDPPRPLVPSRPSEPDPAARSPLEGGDSDRFRRGIVTHKLLQILPDLPDEQRVAAARAFVAQFGHDLSGDLQDSIVKETLEILDDQSFAPLFGPDSLAEVPVTGLVEGGRLISGQIDRLLVTDREILIVDYKTNRPPPQDLRDVPQIYMDQMKAYKDALIKVYPGRMVRCSLLWTDGPRMMWLDI